MRSVLWPAISEAFEYPSSQEAKVFSTVMVLLKEGVVPPSTYDRLPHISEVSHGADIHLNHLQELRTLLIDFKVPKWICIRLVHKHFDIYTGEAMVVEKVDTSEHGTFPLLRPMKNAVASSLHGIHFLVDADGLLQAYEYSSTPRPDVSGLEPFFTEFCRRVTEGGLQHTFGLKISHEIEPDNQRGWTALGFCADRSTVMVPGGLQLVHEGAWDSSAAEDFDTDPEDDDGEKVCIKAEELGRPVDSRNPVQYFFNALVDL